MLGGALFVALDGVSAFLALLVATFFLRAHAFAPHRGDLVLAASFALLGLGFLAVAPTIFGLAGGPALDAFRTGAPFLSTSLLATIYAARRRHASVSTLTVTVVALGVVGTAYFAAYLLPVGLALPPPHSYLRLLRFAEALVLIAISYLVALEVIATHGGGHVPLQFLRVPLGFLFLAFARYSVALADPGPGADGLYFVYGWRLAGLVLIASAAAPALARGYHAPP